MANKPTAREIKDLLKELTFNGYHHLQCIDKEIKDMDIKEVESATEDQKNKLHALTMTFVLINDLLHPVHKVAKKLLPKEYLPLIESYMKRHKISLEQKLIDPCICSSCKEDHEAEKSQVSQS